MKIIIFEGIATSGKSTTLHKLVAALRPNKRVKVVSEDETVMAIVDNSDAKVAIDHVNRILDVLNNCDYDIVIFDRLYLTHVFRTHSTMQTFKEIEDRLSQYDSHMIFLKVDEAAIAKRVELAAEHREPDWKAYIYQKGKTLPEIAEYYITQQRAQLQSLQQSTIPYKLYDTTNHDYDAIVSDIIKNYC